MILIVGCTRDDTLYFESIMMNIRYEKVLNRYETVHGTIFNQDVILLNGVYTSYLTSAIVSHILAKHFVVLVINVGKCASYSKELKVGDIIMSKYIYLGDVDQSIDNNVKVGQIPGFPEYYRTQDDVLEFINLAFEKRTFASVNTGIFVSSNIAYQNEKQIEDLNYEHTIFGRSKNIVFDSVSGGVAVACSLFNIPCVAVKVVARKYTEKNNANNYAQVLVNYAGVGKALVTAIGDIGHNNIIVGGN